MAPKRKKAARPLRCAKCGSTSIVVSGAQQMLKVAGKKREHADVRCGNCGNEWWSRNPIALRLSREADAAHTGGGPIVGQ